MSLQHFFITDEMKNYCNGARRKYMSSLEEKADIQNAHTGEMENVRKTVEKEEADKFEKLKQKVIKPNFFSKAVLAPVYDRKKGSNAKVDINSNSNKWLAGDCNENSSKKAKKKW